MNIKIAFLCSLVWAYTVHGNDHTPSHSMISPNLAITEPIYIEVSLFDDAPIQPPSVIVTHPSLWQRIRQLLSGCFKKP